jgi:mannose-1-phosphate guanylyltransferase
MTAEPWVIVLAGGDGRRLAAVTRDVDGRPVPKQYWPVDGGAPMMRWAIARAARLAPPSRVLTVVNQAHQRFWPRALAGIPESNRLVQPCNRGTAAGVLLAALRPHVSGHPRPDELAPSYGALPVVDLSHDMLERRPQDLRVVRVAPCGWSDLGTPARLQSLLVSDQPAA